MDPALRELLAEGDGGDEVAVVVRLAGDEEPPAGARVVSRLGDVATCRVRRDAVPALRDAEHVASVKAPRVLAPEPATAERGAPAPGDDERRPDGEEATGRGTVVAVLDWGFDFAHPALRDEVGRSRVAVLWDQRGGRGAASPGPYGYGRLLERAAIDAALGAADPYAALGYHPADADDGRGAHGTHCTAIAAGTGGAGRPAGVAPGADLLLVHLDSAGTSDRANLGDSVTLIEALDFADRSAGDRPCVVSLSVGAQGGPHDGTTLVERALDAFVSRRPGRAVAQSAGNYFARAGHAEGRLRPGDRASLGWDVPDVAGAGAELELWYPGDDAVTVRLSGPDDASASSVALGGDAPITARGQEVGRVYHRAREPNSGRNHVDVLLAPAAPAGRWTLEVAARDVGDGRWHAWVERGPRQGRLVDAAVVASSTTGTIANAQRTIAVGAYDARSGPADVAPFSSAGPTLDGRAKPDLVAPGVAVLSARSTPRGAAPGSALVRMSGTSMAAPHVAGTVALMYEAAGRPLGVAELRAALLQTASAAPLRPGLPRERTGEGALDVSAAVDAVRARSRTPEVTMLHTESVPEIPVVYVPGVMGTRLVDPTTGERVWNPIPGRHFAADAERLMDPAPLAPDPNLDNLPMLQNIPFVTSDVARQAATIEGYGALLEGYGTHFALALTGAESQQRIAAFGGTRLRCFVAGYDWRQSNVASANAVARTVARALQVTGAQRAVVVAHSMGGIASRWYLRHGAAQHPPGLGRVSALVLIGSPTHGAPQAYRSLKVGLEQWYGDFMQWALFPALGAAARLRMKRLFPSLYQLLPTQAYCTLNPQWLRFGARAGVPDASDASLLYRDAFTGFRERPDAWVDRCLEARDYLDQHLGSWLPSGITFLVLGRGLATEVGERLWFDDGGFRIDPELGDGDATVPVQSAAAAGVDFGRGNGRVLDAGAVKHAVMPDDPRVIAHVTGLIARTTPALARAAAGHPPGALAA